MEKETRQQDKGNLNVLLPAGNTKRISPQAFACQHIGFMPAYVSLLPDGVKVRQA